MALEDYQFRSRACLLESRFTISRGKVNFRVYPPVSVVVSDLLGNLGGGIGLWRNSLSCFSKLGILPNVVKHGRFLDTMAYLNESGLRLASPDESFSERYPILGLQRSDLQRELVESINNLDANTIHLDSDFSHFEELENESKVIVHFRNKPSIKVDFLIAADGIHSPIRNTISQQKKWRRN